MLPTFVIGLREGIEASLIVGIVAAFLGQRGRRDALRQVWVGVIAAVVLCLIIGVGLELLSTSLPQAQQEGLETVIGLFAVGMVSYMIFWMNRHARGMKRALETEAEHALASGSAKALVVMAFLAVLREGFETSVFMLAALQNSQNATMAAIGALVGVLLAVVVGYGIYRGGVRLNLGRFFKATGLVLVLVAAGLVMSALHTGHEAGWVNFGQAQALDLSWLVQPGTPVESLVTGVLGIQALPTVAEVTGWLVYAIPMFACVLWPSRPRRTRQAFPREVASGATATQ